MKHNFAVYGWGLGALYNLNIGFSVSETLRCVAHRILLYNADGSSNKNNY